MKGDEEPLQQGRYMLWLVFGKITVWGQEWNRGVQFIDLCRAWWLGPHSWREACGFRSGQQGWLMMCMWEWGEDSGTFLGFWSEQQGR